MSTYGAEEECNSTLYTVVNLLITVNAKLFVVFYVNNIICLKCLNFKVKP